MLRKKTKLKHFKRKKVNSSKEVFWFYTFLLKFPILFCFCGVVFLPPPFSFDVNMLLQKLFILMNILSACFPLANSFIHQATSPICRQS